MIQIIKNFFTFSYIVFDPDIRDALVIDPSWNFGSFAKSLASFNLKGILLTHHHADHVNLAEKIALHWRAPVFMSKEEIDYYHFRCENLNGIIGDTQFSLGALQIKAILTPGHTRGGMCYQHENDLFTGDTVFIEGCGMCDLDGGNPYAMFESIQKLKKLISPDTLIYPGHSYGQLPGKPLEFLFNNNIYFCFSDCKKFVDFRMRKNQRGLFDFK
jgi:glyoxylase-like metal-dependent hydrolase (beta-lactamase superfamily II)